MARQPRVITVRARAAYARSGRVVATNARAYTYISCVLRTSTQAKKNRRRDAAKANGIWENPKKENGPLRRSLRTISYVILRPGVGFRGAHSRDTNKYFNIFKKSARTDDGIRKLCVPIISSEAFKESLSLVRGPPLKVAPRVGLAKLNLEYDLVKKCANTHAVVIYFERVATGPPWRSKRANSCSIIS